MGKKFKKLKSNIVSNKLLNLYIHTDIFKIIEACCYWLHIVQLYDAQFYFLIKVLRLKVFSCLGIER